MVIDYTTLWRLLMILLAAAAILMTTAVDHPLVRIGAGAVFGLSILTLLAQLNLRIERAGLRPPPIAEAGEITPLGEGLPKLSFPGSKPVVAVIIAGKDQARYVRDCIGSLKAQTLGGYEAVVVDDCSTDSTLDIVLDAIGADPRFRVIRTDCSVSIGLARNHGVNASSANYLTFLDMDDFLAPDALSARVDVATRHADLPWVAGSYCWHETVDVDTTPQTWRPPKPVHRETISWLGHHDDNFSLASAPLLRRDAFLAVGGFDEAPEAEVALFWDRLLRWGFVLVSTDIFGIADRLRPTPDAVATAIAMRGTMARLHSERFVAQSAPENQAGPFFYAEDLGRYRSALGFVRSTASALGIAVADRGRHALVETLLEDLRNMPYPLTGWEADVRGLASSAAKTVTRARGGRALESMIDRDIVRLVDPLIEGAQGRSARWLDVPGSAALHLGTTVARPVRQRALMPVATHSLRSLVRAGRPFLLLPSAAYHTDELIDLAEDMKRRGFALVAMLNGGRWATTGGALARVDVPAVQALPAGDWLLEFEGLLTFNDWGEYYGEYARYVKDQSTVSFAKVEGVQDWDDIDTGRVRNAYRTSDVVLCQGDNDVRALEGKRQALHIVGSARLEAIWNSALPPDVEPRVVGNVNFTYGVQTEHRDVWVETLREACGRAEVPLDLSLHPSETATYPGLAATEPIRHLVLRDSILVSRFSTVLFEGMARGCSVIYYNPHGEQVQAFRHPNGAFDVAEDPETLADLIQAATARKRVDAKQRAREFFLSQVSIEPNQSVAKRTGDVIERTLARSIPRADD